MSTVTNWAELEAQAFGARFVVGAEAGNAIITTIQLTARDGEPLPKSVMVPFYISAAANGLTIGTAADGAVAISGGTGLMIQAVAKLAGYLVTNASGQVAITMTEAGALTSRIVLVMPTGQLSISPAIIHAA